MKETDEDSTGSHDSWYRDFNKFNFDPKYSTYVCKVKNALSGTEIISDDLILELLSE